jgi:flagellar biogenesis protein FliO
MTTNHGRIATLIGTAHANKIYSRFELKSLSLNTSGNLIKLNLCVLLLALTFTFAIHGVAIAKPSADSMETSTESSQTKKTSTANESAASTDKNQDSNKDDSANSQPTSAALNSEANSKTESSKNDLFSDNALADFKTASDNTKDNKSLDKTDSGSKKSTGKKTTATTEALLNLDYQGPEDQKQDTSFFGNLLSGATSVIGYLLAIAFVLALGIFAIYGVKLFSTKYGTLTGGSNDLVNVLEIKYLAPGKSICLVEIAGKVLVLSMTGNTINHLSDITEHEKVDSLKQAAENKKTEPLQPFQIMLDKITNRQTKTSRKSTENIVNQRVSSYGQAESSNAWQDELHTAGDNIKKLLEEIAEQDKSGRRPRQTTKRDRGGERR